MLIGLDIGNSNITIGIFPDGKECISPLHSWTLTTLPQMTADELAAPLLAHLAHVGVATNSLRAAIVSCVVPVLERTVRQMLTQTLAIKEIHFVSHRLSGGLEFDYPNPAEIGADRIVNAVAGLTLYGRPLIIVDFGTATTFCCLGKNGAYLGGEILPGVGISLQALVNRAAKLSSVPIEKPERVIGKSTAEGMVSGLYYQNIGAIEKIISLLRDELGSARVIATGGFAKLFCQDNPLIEIIDKELTLKGLKLIHERVISGA